MGDIAMRFFDVEERLLQTSLDEPTIRIAGEELEQVPRVVEITGGPQKIEALCGAVKGGLVDVLNHRSRDRRETV